VDQSASGLREAVEIGGRLLTDGAAQRGLQRLRVLGVERRDEVVSRAGAADEDQRLARAVLRRFQRGAVGSVIM
jgi:hypothetical protein